MCNKTGILAVSFGTTHSDTRARTIQAIEQTIRESYPTLPFFRAWTSGMIRRKLERTTGERILSVAEAFAQMSEEGITHAILQPTHIIDGIENQQMLKDAEAFTGLFQSIAFGRPLLSNREDLLKMVRIIASSFPELGREESLLLMGHGSSHPANQIYAQLDTCFHENGFPNIHVATVEASPTLEDVLLNNLKESRPRLVHLAPLMIVAGDHAVNDMAGEGAGSWKNILKKAGYPVTCHMKGLGEYPAVRQMFLEHLDEALS